MKEKSCNLLEQRVDPHEYEQVEPLQPVQIKIYRSNSFRKDLRWLHFDDEPRVQESQQVKDQQPYISISEVYLVYPRGS